MEGPQLTLLIVLLLFIFFSPEQPNVRFHTRTEQDRLNAEKQRDFAALANSTYGELPISGLDLTGLRVVDGLQLQLLPVAQDASRRQQVENWYGLDRFTPVFHHVEGEVKGDFTLLGSATDPERKINLTTLDPGTDYISHVYDRNVSDSEGQLAISLQNIGDVVYDPQNPASRFLVREVKADVAIISNLSPGNGWDVRLRGLHFPSGSILLTTSSRKYNALPALPHFALNEAEFNRATTTMNASLTKIWKAIDQGQADDTLIVSAPKCELIMWLHQKPLAISAGYTDAIEKELSNPDGAPIGEIPPLAFSATIFSPDCGYILQADSLFGPKMEVYSSLVSRMTAAFCLIMMGQVYLMKRQMERCATPSTRSRVSYYTFVIAAFSDGLIFFAMIGLLVIDSSVFLLAGAAAFLCCVHVAFLEVKFIFDIWTVQVGDPAIAQAARQRRATPAVSPVTANTTAGSAEVASPASIAIPESVSAPNPPSVPPILLSGAGLPLPATARASATSPPIVIVTPDQATTTATAGTTVLPVPSRPTFTSLYSRFYFALLNLMFFTLYSLSWSPRLRHIYLNTLAFCFFSLWVPQIYRNVVRNCRKALSWEYVLGTSVLRALPTCYWYVAPRNVLGTEMDPRIALALVCWLALQLAVLGVQQFLGPRIFVRASWCPEAYDYHPVLYDDVEAGGLPIGEITSASDGKDVTAKGARSRKLFDCAICMNEIDVPVISKDKKQGSSDWLEQRNYMVTPCRHIFHTECLDGWMNMRLVCPVCREGLPPL